MKQFSRLVSTCCRPLQLTKLASVSGFNGARSMATHFSTYPSLKVPPNSTASDTADIATRNDPTEIKVINPLEHDDFFGVRNLFTLKELFDARIHMGHKTGVRNPHMKPFIFGTRLNIDIMDLEQTVPMLQDSLNFIAHIAYRSGIILLLSRHRQVTPLVEKTAMEAGEYSHCHYWKGGTITNATIQYGAVTRLPDLMIFVTTHNTVFEQHVAVVEAAKMNIPTVGVVDSSCDPRLITYPIPGNDDSVCAIQLYCRLFKEAILLGKAKRKAMQELGQL